ncbi:hypothetical protein [Clostridium butyricum]|uniref:hypothetical protein n=1 Tax=Clostridium butyricum TaxID=1492 RepID=UPI002AAF853A|nr:hypothetical protein [Clostridium butyricum]
MANKILKFHLKNGLNNFYSFKEGKIKKKVANFSLLQSIRPFIEEYQRYSNDFYGNNLNLNYFPLNILYSDASKITHPDSKFSQKYSPKKLKHDLKILSKIVLGNETYFTVKSKIKTELYYY